MPMNAVDAGTLKSWLDKGEAVLVDVREPAEYAARNIPESVSIPLSGITLESLPDARGKKLVMQCQAGRRGGSACEKLLAKNPGLEIYNLEGGIEAWSHAGYEIRSTGRFFLPLDRQVQLIIGLCVLIGSVLGYYVSPSFFLFTGFFGVGLTFAGLTGFCGLALLLAKMPWNQSEKSPASCCAGAVKHS